MYLRFLPRQYRSRRTQSPVQFAIAGERSWNFAEFDFQGRNRPKLRIAAIRAKRGG